MTDNFLYSTKVEANHPLFGKFEHPIRAILTDESDAQEKKKGTLNFLYNVEKSSKYSETIFGETGFKPFTYKAEGKKADKDTIALTYHKTIYHKSYAKTFEITKEMAEDATPGVASPIMKSRPRGFMQAYYRTRHQLGEMALANGTATGFEFGAVDINDAVIDTTTGDGLPLFSGVHTFKNTAVSGTQSNFFHGLNLKNAAGEYSAGALEEYLAELAIKLRNFKDENGNPLAYIADTIILPGNRGKLERLVKTVVGSENTTGSGNNDINIQYGNWSLVVLPNWQAAEDEFMLMSSDANKTLMGNMFFQRDELSIMSEINTETRNMLYNGFARFGCGFGTWKHILRATASEEQVGTSTEL